MRWPWSRTTRTRPTPLVVRERQAYAAIEEARLWCERILDGPQPDSAERVMTALHREIGIAGFHASHHLRPERRRAMLALAHERTRDRLRRSHLSASFDPLGKLIDHAVDQVRQALGVEGLCDEMEEAHRCLIAARDVLATARTEQRRLTMH